MIQSVLDKRSFDQRLYDIDCSDLLAPEEVITSVTAITSTIPPTVPNPVQTVPPPDPLADINAAGFTFGTPAINHGPLLYPLYNHRADPGKVVQVMISGGVAPATPDGVTGTIRLQLVTSMSPHLEATVALRLVDAAP